MQIYTTFERADLLLEYIIEAQSLKELYLENDLEFMAVVLAYLIVGEKT